MLLANKEGIVVTGPVIQLVAGLVAGALVVFTIPVLAGQLIGVKSVKIRKVMLRNNAAGNVAVSLGTGGVGIGIPAILPAFDSMNNLTDNYGPDDFPEVETFLNICAWGGVVFVAGGTIDVQLEVAIIG